MTWKYKIWLALDCVAMLLLSVLSLCVALIWIFEVDGHGELFFNPITSVGFAMFGVVLRFRSWLQKKPKNLCYLAYLLGFIGSGLCWIVFMGAAAMSI